MEETGATGGNHPLTKHNVKDGANGAASGNIAEKVTNSKIRLFRVKAMLKQSKSFVKGGPKYNENPEKVFEWCESLWKLICLKVNAK